jgi:hypothetical protein
MYSSKEKHIESWEFMNLQNNDHSFEILGGGRQEESVHKTQRMYKNTNEWKELYSH